jgi:excisionase family DNA binding protein
MMDRKSKEVFEKLLGPAEVGEILNLRRSKIHRMISCGEIPSLIISRGIRRRVFRVRPSDLEKWLKAREIPNSRR